VKYELKFVMKHWNWLLSSEEIIFCLQRHCYNNEMIATEPVWLCWHFWKRLRLRPPDR